MKTTCGVLRAFTMPTGRKAMRRHITIMAVVFWGLIALTWLGYPAENRHSIMTHTFSFLGSYEPFHNPRWWWLFTLALVFWGVAMVPLVRYAEKRFAAISAPGAGVGAVLMYMGCAGLVFVGLFPEGQATILGNIKTTHGHMAACVLLEIGFGGGILWHGGMLLRNARGGRAGVFRHRAFIAPYVFLAVFMVTFVLLVASGRAVFPPMTAEKTASLWEPGSAWYASLNTVYSFPLWENLIIAVLFVFLCWFMLLLPNAKGNFEEKNIGI